MKRFSGPLLLLLLSFGGQLPAPAAETPRAVLAELEGEITVPGLKEPVEVLRDHWGIPHIYASNADDLFFAQGFIAAQDRLFQIDLWRRAGIGEIAEVVGRQGLEADRFARLLRYRGDLNTEWASYSADARQIANAFSRGINAYIDHIGDRLPLEFQILAIKPGKWQPEDCLGRMSGIIMTQNFHYELTRAELVVAVGIEKARLIAPTDPPRAYAPAPGLDLVGIDRSILASYNAATRPLPFKLGDDGSNNLAVDGTLSASGKTLLASDPHRTIALPSLRYLVHLNAPGWNVIGSGEPGLPGVAIGHNDHVAWGFTIVGTDQADMYVEETNPGDAMEYRVENGWDKMKIISEEEVVRDQAQPVKLELHFTRHGPVIHEDRQRHRAYALKWARSLPGKPGFGPRAKRSGVRCGLRTVEGPFGEHGLCRRGREHRLGRCRPDAGAEGLGRLATGAWRQGRLRVAKIPAARRVAAGPQPDQSLCRHGQSQHPARGL
jgi:penicillin amidase